MKRYQSRMGIETILAVTILLAFLLFLSFYLNDKTILLLSITGTALCIHWFFTTSYTINKMTLRVKSGFIYDETIKIDTIKRVIEITDIWSAPATSIQRLLIQFNNSESVVISPKVKSGFIKDLIQINQNIDVKLKIIEKYK